MGLEHGRSIALAGRWYSKALGGEFEQVMFTLGRTYLNNPLWDNHVFAMRLVTAVSVGPEFREGFSSEETPVQVFDRRGGECLLVERVSSERLPTGHGGGGPVHGVPVPDLARGAWIVDLAGLLGALSHGVFAEGGNTFGNGEGKSGRCLREAASISGR